MSSTAPHFMGTIRIAHANTRIHAFVDRVFTHSISSQLAEQLKLRTQPNTDITINQVNSSFQTKGRIQTQLTIANRTETVTLHVIDSFRYPLLIGLDIGKQFGLTIDLNNWTAIVSNPQSDSKQSSKQTQQTIPKQIAFSHLMETRPQIKSKEKTTSNRKPALDLCRVPLESKRNKRSRLHITTTVASKGLNKSITQSQRDLKSFKAMQSIEHMDQSIASLKHTTHWTTPTLAADQRTIHWNHCNASNGRIQVIAIIAKEFGSILVYSTGINSTARGEYSEINIF